MLKNDFFHILRITDNQEDKTEDYAGFSYRILVALDPLHPIYDGHFPGNPVVPGVCQLRMITEIISEIMQREVRLVEADTIKFLSMINPSEHEKLTVDCKLQENEGISIRVTATISDQEQVFFKCKAQFS